MLGTFGPGYAGGRPSRGIVTALAIGFLAAAVGGCNGTQTVTEAERPALEKERLAIALCVDRLASAVSAQSTSSVVALLSPALSEKEHARASTAARHLCISPAFYGAEFQTEALDGIPLSEIKSGKVRCSVPTSNKLGKKAQIGLELQRVQNRWCIASIRIPLLHEGDQVKLPPEEEAQVLGTTKMMLGFLRDKKPGDILQMLPDKGIKVNRGLRAFVKGKHEGFFFEVEGIMNCEVTSWPDVMTEGRVHFIDENLVIVPVRLPFRQSKQGDFKSRKMELQFVFGKAPQGWTPLDVIPAG